MPALIANHKKTVVETRLAKFYSTINQAIQMAEADYGDKSQWDTPDIYSLWFEKYLKPYLQLTEYKKTDFGMIFIYFADGSMAIMAPPSFQFFPNANDYKATSTRSISPDPDAGTKYFVFYFDPWENSNSNKYHFKNGVEPYKYDWDGTREMLLEDCKSQSRVYCTALIQMNGWKIPKDYPVRF